MLIIVLFCTFYLYKNIIFATASHVADFFHSHNISRDEDINDAIAMLTSVIGTALIVLAIIFISYFIFRDFFIIPLIGLCLYFKFGTDAGTMDD